MNFTPSYGAISPVEWFVGTCGIADPGWEGNFYPIGWHETDRLEYYARRFNSIELNTTFHGIPARKLVRRWKNVTPPDFRFSVKFPAEVTHSRERSLLADETLGVAVQFFDVVQAFDEKLVMVLMQFPGSFSRARRAELLRFLDCIRCPARLVLEFRSPSWSTRETVEALRERNIGWAFADLASHPKTSGVPMDETLERFACRRLVCTTDFIYGRFIGAHGQFPLHRLEQVDSRPRAAWWLKKMRELLKAYPEVRRAYAFFDNDFGGHAPTSARCFADMVDLPRAFEGAQTDQLNLFGRN